MRTTKNDFDSDESMENLLARATQLVNASQSKVDPRYLAQLELIYATRTLYPYKSGKEDLAQYIYLRKNWIPDAQADRIFSQLWHTLRNHQIIPNDIIDHARELAEENARKRKIMEESKKQKKQNAIIEKVGARGKVFTHSHH